MTDQQIRDRCNRLADMLIRKHKNYGNSAERAPVLQPGMNPGAAIFVRMSDKIERIAALSSGQVDLVGESIEDTVDDLAGYCILWGVLHEERTTEKPFDPAEGKIDDSDFFGPDGIMNKFKFKYNNGGKQ